VIRFGLSAVRNVGDGALDAIIEARTKAGGAFRSVMDVFERVDPRRVNRRVWESLIKAGALDFTGVHRAALLHGLEGALQTGTKTQEDRANGQIGLFGGGAVGGSAYRFPTVSEWPLSQRLACEREVLGLYLSGHPMQAHVADLRRHTTHTLHALSAAKGGGLPEEVRVMGLVVETRVVRTRRLDKMAFVRLEDAETSVECVFFSEAYARSARALECQEPILVVGRVESGEETKIIATSAEPLSDLRARTTREVRFQLDVSELGGERLERFVALLQSQRGACRARLVMTVNGRFEAEVPLSHLPVEPSTEMEESVTALFGRPDVVALC
jgi:DNA polymerase-3 subunit alpha